jgi:hypothetical protein
MNSSTRRIDVAGQLLGVVLREEFYAPVGIVVREYPAAACLTAASFACY